MINKTKVQYIIDKCLLFTEATEGRRIIIAIQLREREKAFGDISLWYNKVITSINIG